jgi:hypothetical protein
MVASPYLHPNRNLRQHRQPKRKELEEQQQEQQEQQQEQQKQQTTGSKRSRVAGPVEDQRAYLEGLKDPNALDFQSLDRYNSNGKKNMRKTLKNYWAKTPAVEVCLDGKNGRYYFDLAENIRNSQKPKQQPPIEQAGPLTTLMDPVLVVKDAHGLPLVVKCGEGITTSILPGNIGPRVMNAALEFCQHTGGGEKDAVRHASHVNGVRSTGDNTSASAQLVRSRCQLIHRAHTAKFDVKYSRGDKKLLLHAGPASLFQNRAREYLSPFLTRLQPLTQIQDVCFEHFLPQDYALYIKIAKALPKTSIDLNHKEPYPVEFGCWPSRSIVLNSPTAGHRDLDDTCWGFCCIVPQGNFTGGYLCLPTLGIKLFCPPGSIIFLRSYMLPHYISDFSGTRISFISFMHQDVVDYYQELLGDGSFVFPLDDMPSWYRKRYT